MGNYPSEHSDRPNGPKTTFKSYIPATESEKENQHDVSLLNEVEIELDYINSTFHQIKNKHPDEIEHQLHTLLFETEKKLSHAIKKPKKNKFMKNLFKSKDVVLSENDSKRQNLDIENLKQEIEHLKKLNKESIDHLEQEEMKNVELLLRLSKIAGEKLTKDNPAITDLSDTNRPTKLGEVYSELYDNEWQDALDGLTGAEHGEEEAIATLHLTLLSVYDFCKKKAEKMLTKTDDAMNYLFEEYKLLEENPDSNDASVTTMSRKKLTTVRKSEVGEEDEMSEKFDLSERWRSNKYLESNTKSPRKSMMVQRSDQILDKLKVFQKEVAEIMVPVVQKAYLKASWKDDDFVPAVKPFIRKCIYVCWLMVVQSIPMCIHVIDVNENDKFDKNLYKEYTSSGPYIKFIVWPAMLLHENGPVVSKGIAQGCDMVSDQSSLEKSENASAC